MALSAALLAAGCNLPNFDPAKASVPYPFELHTTNVLPIQVFRDGTEIEIVGGVSVVISEAICVYSISSMRL